MGLGIGVLLVLLGLLVRSGPWHGSLLVWIGAAVVVLALVSHVRRHRG